MKIGTFKMKLYHGDCLEELKKLEDNSVDAVITDPPYGLSNTKPQQVADVLKAWVTGDTVLDPFAGSGITLQAALSKGFTPIGIEQDADYIELVKERLGLLARNKPTISHRNKAR